MTYDLFSRISLNNEFATTLTAQDYIDIGETFGNLSSVSDIFKAVEFKHPNPDANDVVTLTYEWFSFDCFCATTLYSKMPYYEGDWQIAYVPTDEDYAFMGQSFPNFESRTTARNNIAVLFNDLFKFDDEGSTRTSVFVYTFVDGDVRQFVDFLAVFIFDGSVWVPQHDVLPQKISFGHDGTTWVPDNTIKYTFSGADFAVAADDANGLGNQAARDNLTQFGNFGTQWSHDEVIEAIIFVLNLNFGSAEIGQQYLVTYDTFPGGNQQAKFIQEADGYVEIPI